ncbi:MAG: hypothetical protein JWM86_2000, partial [Thermoleophilia bacterium]|nr:hypothetical protein [Thermoleophilia bacterium]
APACELAMLIGAWIRAQRLDALVETTIVTSDTDPFEWFGPVGEATLESALRRARVRVSSSVPIGRFDDVEGDLTIDFGTLQAREVAGLPGRAPDGWYATDASFQVAPSVFVVGDALSLPYRAGFASAWQARRVLSELGGDLNLLGREVDGVPIGSVEYQMDLADGVLRARIANADSLGQPFLGHDADVDVVSGARPEKLAGLLVHERILGHGHDLVDPPLAFRDLLLRQSRSAA